MRVVEAQDGRTRDFWAIAVSATLADFGYQAVMAGFPLFLVITLGQPVWQYGVASALSYGGGTALSWVGGRLGDRTGHRRLALFGNALIPMLSFCAVPSNPAIAIGLLTGGWWARSLRAPSRRVMTVEAVPDKGKITAAFGLLHSLDVGGGAVAGLYVLVAVIMHVDFQWMFIGTFVPLAVSTVALMAAHTGERAAGGPQQRARDAARKAVLPGAGPLLMAAVLYGFTSYSVGFPVLTTAQSSGDLAIGVVAFLAFQLVSAVTAYVLGPRLGRSVVARFRNLGTLGYLVSAMGAGLLAAGYGARLGPAVLLLGVVLVGFALGVVETLEPSLMAVLRPGRQAGRGFGALAAARSLGLFIANLAIGLLYTVGGGWAYGYAAVVALLAMIVILAAIPSVRKAEAEAGPQAPS